MNPLAVIVAIGKTSIGKVFLLRDLLSRHQSIPVGLVMSATEMANKFFGDFVPGCFIHEGFVEKTLASYIASHKALTEKMKSEQDVMGNPTSIEKISSSWTTWDTMHLSG
jgi:hypothetical protein